MATKSDKKGRNSKFCQAYKLSQRREKNKAVKLLRHIKRYGTTDHCAVHAYNNLPVTIRGIGNSLTPTKSKALRKPPGWRRGEAAQ